MASTLSAKIVDITQCEVDAIVNAANEELAPGGGVCGAIHRAAGGRLAAACARVAPCPTGQARITPGFQLPAKFVIHAVGPIWHGGGRDEAKLLASAYRSSLELCESNRLRSVAFPAISTGIFGYPLKEATTIAVSAAREFLPNAKHLTSVLFACFSAEALTAYREAGISD